MVGEVKDFEIKIIGVGPMKSQDLHRRQAGRCGGQRSERKRYESGFGGRRTYQLLQKAKNGKKTDSSLEPSVGM